MNNTLNTGTNIKEIQKVIVHPSFNKTISEIRKINLTITNLPIQEHFDFTGKLFPPNGKLSILNELTKIKLDTNKGYEMSRKYDFTAYDESKLNYKSLEGMAVFTVHSLVLCGMEDYMPVNYLSFYFYTRSTVLKNSFPNLKYSKDLDSESNFDYVTDRTQFLNDWTLEGTICFIDGPLIGGNMSSYTINLVKELHKKNIIPIFIVKNSDSNLVTDNVPELANTYNSDMHWSYKYLNSGERSSFFRYSDESNSNNSKIFCYLKAFNLSPQRIEMHTETYNLYSDKIDDIMDLVFYLFIAHGDPKNPQIRPIAIAEKYAREILKLSDSYNLIKSSGLVPTMNQERFGG